MPIVQVPQFQGLAQQAQLDPVGALAQQRTIQGQGLANQISGQTKESNQLALNKAKGLLGIAFDQTGHLTPEGAAQYAKVDPIGFHDYTLNAPVKEAEAKKAEYLSQLLSGGLIAGQPKTQVQEQNAPQIGAMQPPQRPSFQQQVNGQGNMQPPMGATQPENDFSSKIKNLRSQIPMASIVGIDLSPQLEQIQREWWNTIKPQMQAIQDKYTEKGKSASPTEWAGKVYNPMMNEVNRAIPPELQSLPEVKSFLASDNFKQPPQPNMTTVMTQPINTSVVSDIGARLGRGELDVQSAFSLVNSMRTTAQNKAKMIDDLFKAAQDANPEFNAAQAKIQFKQAENTTNQSQIAAANNVLTNIDRLVELSDKTSKTGIQGFNHALQNAQYYMGDRDLTDFRVTQMAVAEELSRVFGGNVPSDFKIKYGDKMVDGTLPYENFRSAMNEVKTLVQNLKKTKAATMGNYAPKDQVKTGSGVTAPYADPEKEKRYQAWKAAQGMK